MIQQIYFEYTKWFCKIFASTAAIVFPVGMPRLTQVASHAAPGRR